MKGRQLREDLPEFQYLMVCSAVQVPMSLADTKEKLVKSLRLQQFGWERTTVERYAVLICM